MKAEDGAFSAEVARSIVGITYRQLDYWDKGRGSRRLYSFEDLVELRVVAKLLGAGISLPAVRKATRYVRQQFAAVARPLARLALQAEGKRERVTELRHGRQLSVRVRGRAYTALLTPELEVGGFTIEVAELPGVITEADTLAEARVMVADASALWLDAAERPKARAVR